MTTSSIYVVDMSTTSQHGSREAEIEYDQDLHAFLCGLEADSSLFLPDATAGTPDRAGRP